MKPLLVKHSFLVCALWLLACCTAVASKNYSRRTMWVSTTGEDSPQCIHDMPASAHGPKALPHQPCRSLNYALRNIHNEAMNTIFISCGIHELKPFDSLDAAPLVNVTTTVIEGSCAEADPHGNNVSLIRCTDGANMAFYNIQKVVIKHLSFQDCGEQVQHSDSLSNSPTLYFQDCKTVVVQYSVITITGPYGSGISFVKNDPSTITPGNIDIGFVVIIHKGIHGTGIHFEAFTAMTKDIELASVDFQLKSTHVLHINVHPSYSITTTFTGINITVMGDGVGGKITLFDVTVGRTTRGNGILIAMLERVHGFNVQLTDTSVVVMEWKDSNNTIVNHIPCDEHLSNISQISAVINSTSYFGIRIEVRGNSKENHIRVTTFYADGCRGTPGSALSIEITDESEKNVVQLEDGSSSGYRRGLQVIVTGWARRNVVQVDGINCSEHRALWGAGGYFEFSGHAQENLVNLRKNTFLANHALRGGGIAVVCRDFATQNTFKALELGVFFNSAELGGGVYAILQDSAINNIIHITDSHLYNNTAHRGGGMFIHIQDTTATSRVEIFDSDYVRNSLLPSEVHAMMGGGVHVEFSTVSATLETNNSVKIMLCWFLANTAGQGIGGAISVLYKHSLYQGDSGDVVHVDATLLFHNKAAGGSSCAFQSLPTHEKRLFRGVIVTDTHSFVTTATRQTFSDHDMFTMINLRDTKLFQSYVDALFYQAFTLLREEALKPISPSFQVDTNTNIILAKSVQLTVGYLSIMCAASSQGIYAVDSEIVLEANT